MLETKSVVVKDSSGVMSGGFTLIELLMAMSVFSFMLLIIVMGFMNIVRMHNAAVASNQAQDSARTAMNELVLAVRDSGGVTIPSAGLMCLASMAGQPQQYYVAAGALTRADGCGGTPLNTHQITSSDVNVADFSAAIESDPTVVKPQVKLSLTVGSANGTTAGTGAALACKDSQADRTFCSVITLTSRAVQR